MNQTPRVKDLMRVSDGHVAPEDSLDRCRRLFRELAVDHLPVLERGRLVGLVEGRDVEILEDTGTAGALTALTAASVMQGVPYTVRPEETLSQVARHMAARRLECAVVIDVEGRVIGMLPVPEVLGALAERPSYPPGSTVKEGGDA